MTTEERFTRIEATLERVADRMEKISEAHQELEAGQINLQKALTRFVDETRTRFDDVGEKLASLDDKLSVLVEHDKTLDGKLLSLTENVEALTDAQHATDGKLNALIDTVDRFIRHRNGGA